MTKRFPYIILFASIALAMSAAYYSVFGLSKLFSSQFIAVTILAGTLETSKLITASYLHRAWDTLSNFIRIYLITAVCILMCITSLGIYGFLVSAYQETAYNRDTQDNIGITDTNFATFIQIIEIAQDTVGITDDSLIRQVDFNKNIQDTVTLNDVIGRTANINRILDNSVGITDNVIGSKFIFSSVLDNIGITDSVTLKIVTSDVDNPIIEFYQIDGITPTIYNITNG